MTRLLIVSSTTLFLLAGTALPFQAQQGGINGCYQKNNGQLRVVQKEGDCTPSELAVSWNRTRSPRHPPSQAELSVAALQTLGGTENFGYAINDRGEIVGLSRLAGDGATHAFVYDRDRITDISPFNSGDIQTVGPTSINSRGQVASGLVVAGVYLPAVYDSIAQRVTTLGSLGGVTSFGFAGVATSINNMGEAVGYSYLDGVNRHAFLHSRNVMKDIGSFGGYSAATDINEPGTVVGFASNLSNERAHAFVYSNGTMTDIDPFGRSDFGTSESSAQAINDRGQIVGHGLLGNGTAFHAFLSSRGVVTDLGTLPGGRNSYASGINEPGQVVGTADIPYTDTCYDWETGRSYPCTKFKLSAFLYDKGVMIDLNSYISSDSGWELISAFDLNARGQIVGYGLLDGKFRAFVLH